MSQETVILINDAMKTSKHNDKLPLKLCPSYRRRKSIILLCRHVQTGYRAYPASNPLSIRGFFVRRVERLEGATNNTPLVPRLRPSATISSRPTPPAHLHSVTFKHKDKLTTVLFSHCPSYTQACRFFFNITLLKGTRWSSWLRHCATSRKIAGSIPDGVTGIFH
jgi:hypothetical protein